MGWFKLGSTVVLLMVNKDWNWNWDDAVALEVDFLLGQKLVSSVLYYKNIVHFDYSSVQSS